ncbi:uncharacterized protein LOC141628013 [Silene latifolia]|uniref:uncharacterized protein LOC141628013 n=1 Tax=Silene latifolia TaxID=37657 RepID=UPI003D77D0D4
MASKIGKPLFVDYLTTMKTKLSFARVLVEVDRALELPNSVVIKTSFQDQSVQRIHYVWLPYHCKGCGKLGHEEKTCKFSKTASKPAGVVNSNSIPYSLKHYGPLVLGQFQNFQGNILNVQQDTQNISSGGHGIGGTSDYTASMPTLSLGVLGSGCSLLGLHRFLKRGCKLAVSSIMHSGHLGSRHKSQCFDVHQTFTQTLLSNRFVVLSNAEHFATGNVLWVSIVYSFNSGAERKGLWSLLRQASVQHQPLLTLGDFNVVRDINYRISPNPPNIEGIMDFNECIAQAGLEDVNGTSCLYTWTNKQESGSRMWSKMDRAMVNQSWLDNVAKAFVDYYTELLGTETTVEPLDSTFIAQGATVQLDYWVSLAAPVSNLEIKNALFSKMVKQANTTLISLLPKKKVLKSVQDYRPLSCCSTIYKVISKILAIKMQNILPKLIGGEQPAFSKAGTSLKIGDLPSVSVVVQTLEYFGRISGLKANSEKTSIFFGGVQEQVMQAILDYTRFQQEDFPFSYAGKLQLIQSVIFGLQNYWCASILLPRGVIKLINNMCKDFFWQIQDGLMRMTFKSWKANKKYSFKGIDVWNTPIKENFPDSLKGILKTRDACIQIAGNIQQAKILVQNCASNGRFLFFKSYEIFTTKYPEVYWAEIMSRPAIIPSHRITVSLALEKQLPTVDNIVGKGLLMPNMCCFCKAAAESHVLLFFRCAYAQEVWQGMLR